MSESRFYNDVPETRGVPRNRGVFGAGGSGRDREDAVRLAAWQAGRGNILASHGVIVSGKSFGEEGGAGG